MAINSIPQIKIGGSTKPFGGYIFNLNYNIKFSEGPNEITAHLLSENGQYQDPELSTKNPYKIEIGTQAFNYYAVSYTKDKSAQGRTLEVKFVDDSIKLDKTWVGLHKRHGDATSGKWSVDSTKSLLIVGQEFHPCDTNKDGIINYLGLTGIIGFTGHFFTGEDADNYVSPYSGEDTWSGYTSLTGIGYSDSLVTIDQACDPCPFCPQDKYFNKCNELSCYQVFEVGYNFDTLYSGISGCGIKWGTPKPVTNPYYFTEYVGSIREVLRNWGADYGFDFYWETGRLHLLDVRQPLIMNTGKVPVEYIESESYTKSLEGTESRGCVSYYERAGEKKPYNCDSREFLKLRPLTIYDYFGNFAGYTGNANNISTLDFENATALSYYHTSLRDAYWWYYSLEITGSNRATQYLNSGIPAFGDMQIKKVINPASGTLWTTCLNTVSEQRQADVVSKGGYFIVISGNEQKIANASNLEEKFANNIIGKYFYKSLVNPFCGGDLHKESINVSGPDKSNGEWFSAGTPSINLPFAGLPYDNNTNIYNLFNESYFQLNGEDEISRNIAIINKDPQWLPIKTDKNLFNTGIEKLNGMIFEFVGEGNPDGLSTIIASDSNIPNKSHQDIKLVVAYSGYSTFSRGEVDNPSDLSNVDRIIRAELLSGQCSTGLLTLETYGLMNASCIKINFNMYTGNGSGIIDATIYTPSQGLMLDWTPPTRGDGYIAIAEQNYSEEVMIPKAQTILQNFANTGETMNFTVNYRTITDSDFRVISGLQCIPNSGLIQAAHNIFNSGMTYTNDKPYEKVSYSFPNIDLITGTSSDRNTSAGLTIKDGLVGIDISYGSDGLKSTYHFANRPPRKPSMNIINRNMEMAKRLNIKQ